MIKWICFVYESNVTVAGNYSADGNWNPIGSPALSSGIGPVGAVVRINPGDTVDLDISNIRLYSTEVQEGGVLRIPSGSVGNRLGNVSGTGIIMPLRLVSSASDGSSLISHLVA